MNQSDMQEIDIGELFLKIYPDYVDEGFFPCKENEIGVSVVHLGGRNGVISVRFNLFKNHMLSLHGLGLIRVRGVPLAAMEEKND